MIASIEDIVVEHVNQLRRNLSTAQKALDDCREALALTKKLEFPQVMELEAEIDKLKDICRKQEEDRKGLDTEIAALREHHGAQYAESFNRMRDLQEEVRTLRAQNTTLTNAQNDLRDKNRLLSEQNVALIKERNNVKANVTNINVWAKSMGHWCEDTFGEGIYKNPQERAARLVEEAIEVAQVAGVQRTMLMDVLNMVYNKPRGAMRQELGGVIVCWAVMVQALGLHPHELLREAHDDCWQRQKEIAAKLANKIAQGASPTSIAEAERIVSHAIDGDAAIKEGKANRSRFILSAAPELSSKDE